MSNPTFKQRSQAAAASNTPPKPKKAETPEEKAIAAAAVKELTTPPPIELGEFQGEIKGFANLYADSDKYNQQSFTLDIDGPRSGVILFGKKFFNPPHEVSFEFRRISGDSPLSAYFWDATESEPALLPTDKIDAGQCGRLFIGGKQGFELQGKGRDIVRTPLSLACASNVWYFVRFTLTNVLTVQVHRGDEIGEELASEQVDSVSAGSLYFCLGYPWTDSVDGDASFEIRNMRS